MVRYGIAEFLFLILGMNAFSQSYKTNDTLLIDEIQISAFRPVNDGMMLKFYKTSNFSSIDDITGRLGGVSLIRRGAYAMEPLLNGMGAGRINVTIDGMHMFGACTDKMDPVTSYIEPANLASIQVLSGTDGNKMGNTVGGSLNLVTEQPQPGASESFGAEAGVAYSSISNGVDGNLSFYLNQDKWAFLLSTTTRNHNPYKDGNGETVSFSQFSKKNMHASLAYMLKENQILKADVLLDDARDVGYPALPMDVALARGNIYSLDYKMWDAGMLDLLKVKIYANTIYHLMDDSQRDSVYYLDNKASDTVVMRMDMPGWSNTFGAYAEADLVVGEKGHLFVKSDSYMNFARAEMTMFMRNYSSPGEPPMYVETWPDMQRFLSGLYFKYSHTLAKDISVHADLRLDYSTTEITSAFGKRQFSIFGYDIEEPDSRLVKGSSLALDYRPGSKWSFYLSGGYSERLPDISELYGFYLFNAFDGYDYIGNPLLETETALNAILKVNYTSKHFKVRGESGLHSLSNYIMGITQTGIPKMNLYASGTRTFENNGNTLISGSSLYVQWQPTKALALISTLRYTYGQLSSGDPLPLMEPLKNYTTAYFNIGKLQLQLENEYAAAQKRINTNYGETESSAYNLVNFRLLFTGALEYNGVEIGIGVNNVFNKTYKSHLDWGHVYRPGRSFYMSLRIKI